MADSMAARERALTQEQAQRTKPRLALVSQLRRVKSLGELYGKGYKWDGACECGENKWETSYWDSGWQAVCADCRRWVCYHELGGVAHTSGHEWAPYPHYRRPRPPAGCPCLPDLANDGPGGV